MNRTALLLLFVLGAWSAATVFMWQVAIRNFEVANGLAASPTAGFRETLDGLDAENLRLAVRYQASEVNRMFFNGWGWTQLPIALLALLLAVKLPGRRLVWIGVTAMLLITLVLQFYVVPETIRIGRLIDFVAEGELPTETDFFWTLHHSYTGLDMLKMLLGLSVAGVVAFRTPSK